MEIISLEEYLQIQTEQRIDRQYILALREEAANCLALAQCLEAQARMRALDQLDYSQIGDPRNEQ